MVLKKRFINILKYHKNNFNIVKYFNLFHKNKTIKILLF